MTDAHPQPAPPSAVADLAKVVQARPIPAAALYAFFVALASVAFADTLTTMSRAWFMSSAHLHGAFAAPTAAALIYARRAEWAGDGDGGTRAPGVMLLAAALAAMLIGRAAGIDALRQFAFVGVLIAGFIAAFGAARAIRYAAPLGFLFFMPPLGDGVAAPMQRLTADAVALLLPISGIDVDQNGVLLTAGGRAFAVTEACSGVRMLTAMMMLAFLLAYMALDDARRRIAVLAAGLALALAANWLRVFLVIAITVRTDDRFGLAHDHFLVGGGAFAVAAAMLVMLTFRLKAGDPPRSSAVPASQAPHAPERPPALIAAGLAMVLAAGAYDSLIVARAPIAGVANAPAPLSLDAIGWRAAPAPAAAWRPSLDHADAMAEHLHTDASGRQVRVWHGVFTHDRPDAEIAGYDTAHTMDLNAGGVSTRRVESRAFGANLKLRVMTTTDGSGCFAATRLYRLGDRVYADAGAFRFNLAAERLRGKSPDGGVIIIYADGADAAAAELALTDFLNAAEPLSRWRARATAGGA